MRGVCLQRTTPEVGYSFQTTNSRTHRTRNYYSQNMAESTPSTSSTPNINPSSESEKKKKRKAYLARRDATKIYLFDTFERWRALKESKNLKSDKDVAEMLLESYPKTGSIMVRLSVDKKILLFIRYVLFNFILTLR